MSVEGIVVEREPENEIVGQVDWGESLSER